MNKKVDSEFVGIKDFYVLQCMCTEMKDEILFLRNENVDLKKSSCAYNFMEEEKKYQAASQCVLS